MDIDIKKIEELVSDGKIDEAKALMKAAIEAKPSEAETGALLTMVASVYMQMINSVNKKYAEILDETLGAINKIDVASADVDHKLKIIETKKSLNM